MTTDELRAKFEEWCLHRGINTEKRSNGHYLSDEVCFWWKLWSDAHASRDAEVEALRKDVDRLNWLERDMKAGSDGTSIYYCLGRFCCPYLSSSGVGEKSESTLRKVIDSAMRDNN